MITKDVTSPNEIILEFKKCYDDMRYFISNYIKIPVFGTGDFINLVPYPSQEQYLNALDDIWTKQEKNGIIFLASRQCGKTQLTEAVIAIKLKNPSAKVFAYKLAGELKLDLPVTGLSIAAEDAPAQGE